MMAYSMSGMYFVSVEASNGQSVGVIERKRPSPEHQLPPKLQLQAGGVAVVIADVLEQIDQDQSLRRCVEEGNLPDESWPLDDDLLPDTAPARVRAIPQDPVETDVRALALQTGAQKGFCARVVRLKLRDEEVVIGPRCNDVLHLADLIDLPLRRRVDPAGIVNDQLGGPESDEVMRPKRSIPPYRTGYSRIQMASVTYSLSVPMVVGAL
ncbi:hypothetical protein [Thiorhodococcus minor]|uniref:Uncharacterized protein n=1 Tax=Thiorhodococcus minor TaxID=57489 RepID=A0A6M0JS82_9GAMM|nr:hypothetical protein [Thiorhodococcus minor]NEV60398.1 hypothetical protein [Thiorhodococcus minor]